MVTNCSHIRYVGSYGLNLLHKNITNRTFNLQTYRLTGMYMGGDYFIHFYCLYYIRSSCGSVDSACGSWSMGRGFKSHQGHWWCQEEDLTTIAPVLRRQISPKTCSEKNPLKGFSQGMETLHRR